jgi:hypothetical protein
MAMPLALGRRDLARGALAFAALSGLGTRPAAARGIPPSNLIPFTALREDSELGQHRVRFARSGGRLTVDIDIALEVKIGFITVFRYSHRGHEEWRDGRLISMETRTDDDGEEFRVDARATSEGLRVTGSGGDYLAPAETIPGSYWNIALLDRPEVLNSQKGELTPIDTRFLGSENISAGPRRITADHHRIIGPTLVIDVWYNDADQWVKLAADIRGSRLEYVLQPGGPGFPNLLGAG